MPDPKTFITRSISHKPTKSQFNPPTTKSINVTQCIPLCTQATSFQYNKFIHRINYILFDFLALITTISKAIPKIKVTHRVREEI